MHLYTGVVLLITFMHWGGQSNLTFIYLFLKGTNWGPKGNVIPSLTLIQSGHLCDGMEVSVMHSHGNDIFWENCQFSWCHASK